MQQVHKVDNPKLSYALYVYACQIAEQDAEQSQRDNTLLASIEGDETND